MESPHLRAPMPTSCTIGRLGQFAAYERECRLALEQAWLRAADRAARLAIADLRRPIFCATPGSAAF